MVFLLLDYFYVLHASSHIQTVGWLARILDDEILTLRSHGLNPVDHGSTAIDACDVINEQARNQPARSASEVIIKFWAISTRTVYITYDIWISVEA